MDVYIALSGIYQIVVKFQTNPGPRMLNLNEFIDPF
jgi:hypothetical protein